MTLFSLKKKKREGEKKIILYLVPILEQKVGLPSFLRI